MALKVLVTGGGGYIGRHVIKNLLDLGNRVIALDFLTDDIDDRAEKHKIDIFNEHAGLFERLGKPDVMIHLAWKDGFRHNSKAHMEFLSSHYNFIISMVSQGLKQVVVMGSMHEVGYFNGEIKEDTPTNPRSLYGVSKDCLRRALTLDLESSDIVLQWVRAFYILGDDERNSSIFTKIIQAEREGKEKFPFTTGTNEYDFIDIDTLGHMIAKVACQNKISGVINCCSGKPRKLKDVVEEFIQEKGFNISLEYGVFPDRPYDSPKVFGNVDKINRILNDN